MLIVAEIAHGQAAPRRPRPIRADVPQEEAAYEALIQEFDDKRSEWGTVRRAAKTEDERTRLDREFDQYKALTSTG
jgi:hypothetical protein